MFRTLFSEDHPFGCFSFLSAVRSSDVRPNLYCFTDSVFYNVEDDQASDPNPHLDKTQENKVGFTLTEIETPPVGRLDCCCFKFTACVGVGGGTQRVLNGWFCPGGQLIKSIIFVFDQAEAKPMSVLSTPHLAPPRKFRQGGWGILVSNLDSWITGFTEQSAMIKFDCLKGRQSQ